ncbi:MAG: DUF3450 domain-containing protein [Spirochaetaceae bacterium]|jgi:hypothetical protein|nr:DUF3450 domain-containing protein [Spirochaetaceae bacterium]
MEELIETIRGKVLGIGKLKIPKSTDFNFIIPALSFLVIKETDDSYISTCIHLQIDGYGKTEEKAILDMHRSVNFFLQEIFSNLEYADMAWVRFGELLSESTHQGTDLWEAYHKVQIYLSKLGISTDETETLKKWIKQLEKRVERLEENRESLEIKKDLSKVLLKPEIGYTPIRMAA